jgi:hypothetical protein
MPRCHYRNQTLNNASWWRFSGLRTAGSPLLATGGSSDPSVLGSTDMLWFQVDVPLVAGCLLMAALMDLRLFKWCLLIASILLMLLSAGVIVFGTKLEMIPANAVSVLSVVVWLGCVVSVITRRFRSKRAYQPFGRKADEPTVTHEETLSGGAWMLGAAPGRLIAQMPSELHSNRLISPPSGRMLYGVVLGEAGWAGPVELIKLDVCSSVDQGPEPLLEGSFNPVPIERNRL